MFCWTQCSIELHTHQFSYRLVNDHGMMVFRTESVSSFISNNVENFVSILSNVPASSTAVWWSTLTDRWTFVLLTSSTSALYTLVNNVKSFVVCGVDNKQYSKNKMLLSWPSLMKEFDKAIYYDLMWSDFSAEWTESIESSDWQNTKLLAVFCVYWLSQTNNLSRVIIPCTVFLLLIACPTHFYFAL